MRKPISQEIYKNIKMSSIWKYVIFYRYILVKVFRHFISDIVVSLEALIISIGGYFLTAMNNRF